MTCIVGYAHAGKVWMGADNAGVSGWDLRQRRDRKVFINGEYLMGFTSSFRMGQLLQHSLNVPIQSPGQSDEQHMMTAFVDSVRACLKDGGFATVNSNAEEGGEFLVGYRGALYVVYSDFQVECPAGNFAACGCGENYALGVLAALEDRIAYDTETVLTRSLEVAAQFSAGVRGPFTVLAL